MHKVGSIWTWINEKGEPVTEIIWTDVMDDYDEDEQTAILYGVAEAAYGHFEDEDGEEWENWF